LTVALPARRTGTFPGRYESLASIGAWIHQAAEDAGFDPAAIYTIETAVDEACSNIIEHAYGGENLGEIECTCILERDALTIILHDKGKPFNPESVDAPNLTASLEEREDHGLGLYFMRQWMDEVRFEFNEKGGNTLVMMKRKEPQR